MTLFYAVSPLSCGLWIMFRFQLIRMAGQYVSRLAVMSLVFHEARSLRISEEFLFVMIISSFASGWHCKYFKASYWLSLTGVEFSHLRMLWAYWASGRARFLTAWFGIGEHTSLRFISKMHSTLCGGKNEGSPSTPTLEMVIYCLGWRASSFKSPTCHNNEECYLESVWSWWGKITKRLNVSEGWPSPHYFGPIQLSVASFNWCNLLDW